MAKATSKKVSKSGSSKEKKWVLAVDPFSDLDQGAMIEFAQKLAGKAGAQLLGAYALAPESLNWMGEFSGPWLKKYEPLAKQNLDARLAGKGIPHEVVKVSKAGLRAAVQGFLSYAKKQKADCIVVATHARTGLERWAMGSFSETVVLSAPSSVLVLHPSQSLPSDVRTILMPTDLSKKSVQHVLTSAKSFQKLSPKIELYYKLPDPLDPLVQQGVYTLGGGWVNVHSYLDKELTSKRKELEALAGKVRALGLECRVNADNGEGSLIDGIHKAVKDTGADLISLRTETGRVAAVVVGSVARILMRTATVPVWIHR